MSDNPFAELSDEALVSVLVTIHVIENDWARAIVDEAVRRLRENRDAINSLKIQVDHLTELLNMDENERRG
jgi:hypothetical protein